MSLKRSRDSPKEDVVMVCINVIAFQNLRRRFRRFWVELLCLCCWLSLISRAAQPYLPRAADPMLEDWRWQKLAELDGKFPRCLTPGAEGSLWVGVADGVMRYDGTDWRTFSARDGLDGLVNALYCATNGDVYAATTNGIERFAAGRWARCFPPQTNSTLNVARVLQAADGCLWAGGDGVIFQGGDKQWIFYCREDVAPVLQKLFPGSLTVVMPTNRFRGVVQAICQARDGAIWFAFNSGEVERFDGPAGNSSAKAWRTYSRADGFHPGRGEQFIYQTREGLLWFGNGQHNVGISQYDPVRGTWNYFRLNDILGVDDITVAMTQTPDGTIWVGGFAKLFRYREGQWQAYGPPNAPVTTAEVCGLAYANDYLWLAGQEDCLLKVDVSGKYWQKFEGLNYACDTRDGRQWFIDGSNGVVSCNGTNWLRYDGGDGLMTWPCALLGTRQGMLWAAGGEAGGGAATACFDGERWHMQLHTNLDSHALDFRAALEAADGSLWFATYVDGSIRGDDGGLLRYNPAAGPPEADKAWSSYMAGRYSTSYGFAQRKDGTLYSGSFLGLVQFDGTAWTMSASFGNERVDGLCTSTDGSRLWIGTRGHGVIAYDGRTGSRFLRADGLGANAVGRLFCDRDNHLWASTSEGVSYFDGRDWVANLFPGKRLGSDAGNVRQSGDGSYWLNQCSRNWMRRVLPTVKAGTGTREDFWTVRYRRRTAPPRTQVLTCLERVPPPGDTVISWRGADPWSMTPESELMYSYRLNGGPWSKFAPELNHKFLELSAGRYVFEVRTRDHDLNTDLAPARVTFTVLPPVWQQGWFVALVGALLAVIARQTWGVIRRDRRLFATNESLEAEIEERKRMQAEMERTHRQLVEASHMAGRAEVATSVLHNVGNVLNSINISTSLVYEAIQNSRVRYVGRLADMVLEHRDKLAEFLTDDPRGRQLPDYLARLSANLASEQEMLAKEVEQTRKNVEHIKDIVTMQQTYAKVAGVTEKVKVTDLVEDALRINAGGLTRNDIQVVRDYPPETVEIEVDRQKVLQILINLIRNAKYACDESCQGEKRLTMRVQRTSGGAQIVTEDNGVGIPAENLTRIFSHGFTTRKDGHGFGLHSSALAAQELGGGLNAFSEGPGKGARFVLDLPPQNQRENGLSA